MAGTIQQLAIHSVGGVVTSAQALMIVVPDSPSVTAEVSIANQDIGFVNAGQMAEVKLKTFPYTRYGTVQAKVDVVTADAVTDDKKGSYYPATLTLAAKDMLIDGKRVPLSGREPEVTRLHHPRGADLARSHCVQGRGAGPSPALRNG